MNKKASIQRSEEGQSLVEFAISLTFLLILLAGAVNFGIGLFHFVAMRDAAQEGALYGSMQPDDNTGIRNRVANAAGGDGLISRLYANGSGPLQVAISYSGAHCEGNGITVTLTYPFPLTVPFLSTFIGSNTINLRAEVTDTILTPPCP